jgi:hypothetical protein
MRVSVYVIYQNYELIYSLDQSVAFETKLETLLGPFLSNHTSVTGLSTSQLSEQAQEMLASGRVGIGDVWWKEHEEVLFEDASEIWLYRGICAEGPRIVYLFSGARL